MSTSRWRAPSVVIGHVVTQAVAILVSDRTVAAATAQDVDFLRISTANYQHEMSKSFDSKVQQPERIIVLACPSSSSLCFQQVDSASEQRDVLPALCVPGVVMATMITPPAGDIPLHLGNSFYDPHHDPSYWSLRYDFKPASMNTEAPGTLRMSADNQV